MLNPFPELIVFALIAPFLIRIFLGGYYLLSSARWMKKLYAGEREKPAAESASPPLSTDSKYGAKNHVLTWLLFLGSISVLIGAWTQVGALALGISSLYFLYTKKEERWWYGALFIMSLSTIFTGAGFFAFDLPL